MISCARRANNEGMWARVHKLDRVRPLPNGGAIVLIQDGRSVPQMQRVPSLSTVIAVARILGARRALDAKFGGKGEIRYCAVAVPSFLSEAIVRAGASIASSDGERVHVPAQPASVASMIDIAFADLAHHTRSNVGDGVEVAEALKLIEQRRRAAPPLDKDAQPELYWPAVFELAALAGEQARRRGGRWIDTRDVPVPFAVKFADGAISHPTVVAQKIVEGIPDELDTQ
ncbi:MAG: hypothetical protein AB7T06_39930 [Kofleriaceae bacterium]